MTKVTVIIPAYNAEQTIERTLTTALCQSHEDLEVFVIDDGSTDDTAAIVGKAARTDRRVTLLSQCNAGVAAARNHGLGRASGAFTTWLDADDLWHPTKIEKQLAAFFNAPETPSFVYTGYRLIDPDDVVIDNFRTLTDISGRTICRQIATNFFSNVSSLMVPTSLVRSLGGHCPNLRKWGIEGAEDLLLQLQLSSIGPAACCREALVGYRMHSHNMSLGYLRALRSNMKVLDMIEESSPGIPSWVHRLGRARTIGYALHILREGDLRGALKAGSIAAKGQPLYAALTLALIGTWQIRKAVGLGPPVDPALGQHFLDADPRSVPWAGHMLLTDWHQRRLDAVDRQLARMDIHYLGSNGGSAGSGELARLPE